MKSIQSKSQFMDALIYYARILEFYLKVSNIEGF